MHGTRTVKIKRKSEHETPLKVQSEVDTIGANAAADSNVSVAAKGAIAVTKAGDLDTAITDKDNAHNAAIIATGKMHSKNTDAVKAYNDLATVIEQEYPDAPDTWK